jgi:hypothetical protein
MLQTICKKALRTRMICVCIMGYKTVTAGFDRTCEQIKQAKCTCAFEGPSIQYFPKLHEVFWYSSVNRNPRLSAYGMHQNSNHLPSALVPHQ